MRPHFHLFLWLACILALGFPSRSAAQPADAGIRLVHVHPWAPAADIYISDGTTPNALLMGNLGYLDASQMHMVTERSYTITATVAGDSNMVINQGIVDAFAGGEQTILALAPAMQDIQLLILNRAMSMDIPEGKGMIRIVQGSTIADQITVRIIDSSGASANLAEMEFAATTAYMEIATGGFTVLLSDDDGIFFQGRASMSAGMAATLIISNDASASRPFASLLIDNDSSRQEPMRRLAPLSSVQGVERPAAALLVAPNPAKDRATIPFHLSLSGRLQGLLYDRSGKLVATVADEFMEAGHHSRTFPVTGLPAGLYLLRLVREGNEVIGETTVRVVR